MRPLKILVSAKVAPAGLALLREAGTVDTYSHIGRDELKNAIGAYDALIVRGDTVVDEEVVAAGVNLKVIGRAGLEVDQIDIPAATRHGVMVLNAPQGASASHIEYTIGMLLALSRQIPLAYAAARAGNWERESILGTELREKTLGIIGFGRVGAGLAERASSFHMKILAHDPFISKARGREMGAELTDLPSLFAQSDYISLHIPLSEDSRHLLGAEAFGRMKPGVRVINCARGGLIDETALLAALQSGRVAGAALDGFEEEPLKADHPFLNMKQVICTPRLAARTLEAENEVAVVVARGVLAALRAEPVATSLNIPPVSRSVMETIRPYLILVEKMGALAVHLTGGGIKSVEVSYNGEISAVDTKMLTLGVLKGILNPILQEDVNFVNAPEVAKARGITVTEFKSPDTENFVDLITVKIKTDEAACEVAGTLFGRALGRIVRINGCRVDVEPQGWLLWIPHDNMPGMVGKVGLALGEKGININSMQLAATEDKSVSVMILSIGQDVGKEVARALVALDGVHGVKKVVFN
ncbi:MAG: phosphoglycerate dehydrogenase [Gracilibacteraceae bacterium]|nr:phosphoglycerate dehydrogenase [Gracilibacteraceae bacterium]